MAAFSTPYVQIGTLILRTRAIDCFDWSDLFQTSKRGQDRVVPGVAGRAVRPRQLDAVRAALPVRLNGAYVVNTWTAGDAHRRVYDHLADLDAIVSVLGVQTLTFHYDSSIAGSADCIVEGATAPTFDTPSVARVVLDVTLPNAPLALP